MHILQIVIKNTSTMDFTVPVLVEIKRKRPEVRITVLYCVMDRHNILRESEFWNKLFDEYKIEQVDFSNFLRPKWRTFERLFRFLFSGSKFDKIHFHEMFDFYRRNNNSSSKIGFVFFLVSEYGLFRLFDNLCQSVFSYIESRLTERLIDLNNILPKLAPEYILFDNRSLIKFPGRDDFYTWMYRQKIDVALLPHAPHLRDPVSEFCAFDGKGEELPDFCEFWVPFKFGTPWKKIPNRYNQFFITGYPGLDSKWLNWCRGASLRTQRKNDPHRPVRCLFVMRRYMPKGAVRPPELDPYIVDYDDFYGTITALAKSFIDLGQDVELIIKPHPANNYSVLVADMKKSGFDKWRISHDPIYPLLSQIDIVVGLFSTVLLIPAMAGIPTVLIKTDLQNVVHSEWPLLKEMYTGLSYYVPKLDSLTDTVNLALGHNKKNFCKKDVDHLRYFFPDNAIPIIVNRVFKQL